ncbi:response regulator transcription factor [uncultured Fusobacterium sp.]|uniref:response regulator transcription factor n=1 Tax=uncultured Fusobacterium sp. TaxID=159267 RepID=UPI002596A67C|nr:response regulator transcription factor [uncultured Fusobacterium sp.]
MGKKILIVDDEIHILELLKLNLEIYGYEVFTTDTGKGVMSLIEKIKPDIILLDLMLPEVNGIDICKRIRNNSSLNEIRILIISAKSEEIDKIVCLEIGADDYITKPFSLREIIARINAFSRRIESEISIDLNNHSLENNENYIYYKDLKIDLIKNIVYKNNNPLELTIRELKLLIFLLTNKGKVISREKIFESVWNYENNNQTRSLDVHIRKLRQKLEDKNNSYIETIRGTGYKIPDNI